MNKQQRSSLLCVSAQADQSLSLLFLDKYLCKFRENSDQAMDVCPIIKIKGSTVTWVRLFKISLF